jgi:serine/threonine protein kinase
MPPPDLSDSDPSGGDPTRPVPSPEETSQQVKKIGKYAIVKKLGQGGMGAVFLAQDEVLKRQVALKVLPRDKAENPTLVRRFQSEAEAAAHLDHPNIIAVHDSGEANGYLFIALEFVDGSDLANMVSKRGVLPVKRSIEVIKQAAQALQHAAEHKIVHRDIKPANLMIRRDGVVKLADMGLARILDEGADTSITRTGTTVGTVDYMSPEQARDSKSADIRSDIYSLGCAWYYLLTGGPPFPEGGVTNKLHAHFKTPFPDPRDNNPQVPEAVSAVMRRMTEKNPARRYQTPAELIADLQEVQDGGERVSSQILSDTPTPAASTRAKSRRAGRPAAADEVPTGETVEELATPTRRRRNIAASQLPVSGSGRLGTAGGEGLSEWKSKLSFYGTVAVVLVGLLSGITWLAMQMNRTVDTGDPTLTEEQLAKSREALAKQGQTITGSGETSGTTPESQSDPGVVEDKTRRVGEEGAEESTQVVGGPKAIDTSPGSKQVGGGGDTEFFAGATGKGPGGAGANRRQRDERAALPRWAREPIQVPNRQLVVDPSSNQADTFRSVNQALDNLPAGGARILLTGAGPFPVKPTRVEGRGRVIIEALHPEDRPLLVLLEPEGPAVHALLEFVNTSLDLQNVHFAATVTDYATLPNDAFLHVVGGDLTARGCSFSARGIPRQSMAALRISAGDAPPPSLPAAPVTVGKPKSATEKTPANDDIPRQKVFLTDCLVRGDKLSAVWSESPLVDLVLHESLLISGTAPAVHFDAGPTPPELIRQRLTVVASTVVSNATAIDYAPAASDDWKCAVTTVNSLFGSPAGESGSTLFQLVSPDGSDARSSLGKNFTWASTATTAPGWKTLAKVLQTGQADTNLATSLTQWNLLFGQDSGATDKSFPLRAWPTTPLNQPWDLPVSQFDRDTLRQVGVDLEVAGGGPPGCAVAGLTAPSLLELDAVAIQGRRPVAPPGLLGEGGVSGTIKVDLNRQDLGAVLGSSQLSNGTTVIASGHGLCQTSPITIRQAWIRLKFVQMPGQPLVLVPRERRQAGGETDALITVTQGGLHLQGAALNIAPPGYRGSVPRWLISAFDSDLVLRHCRLQGSLTDPGNQRRGVVQFRRLENSTAPAVRPFQAEARAYLWIEDCQLVGNGRLIDADVAQRVVHLQRSIALSRNTVLAFGLAELPGSEGQVDLSQCTLSAGETFLSVENPVAGGTGQTRVKFHSDRCVFGPAASGGDRQRPLTLLAAPSQALAGGQLQWWEMLNGYSADVGCLLRESAQPAERQEFETAWIARWTAANCLSPLHTVEGVRWAKPLPTKPGDLEDVEPAQFALHANCAAAVWDGGTRPIGAPLDVLRVPTPQTALQLPTEGTRSPAGRTPNNNGGF